jgi:hypothetical protein
LLLLQRLTCGYAEHTFDNCLILDAAAILQLLAVRVMNPMSDVVSDVNVVAASAADLLMRRTYLLMCHVYLTPDAVATSTGDEPKPKTQFSRTLSLAVDAICCCSGWLWVCGTPGTTRRGTTTGLTTTSGPSIRITIAPPAPSVDWILR